MTAQILSRELENIIQESKKKHSDVKNAAEKSLRELKALTVTSEAQLAADLRRRPQFSSPILSACKLGSTKLSGPAIICLQRLVVSGGLASEKLSELLEVFLECSKSNNDIQLRVLQSLPSLLQNYSNELEGDLQATILQVCTTLQQSKNVAVSSSSAATLQQIISTLFEKVESEDAKAKSIPSSAEVEIDGGKIAVRPVAHDAFRVLDDLCSLTEGQPARFIKGASIGQAFGLELMEAILANHGDIFDSHKELAFLLRTRILPLITRFLSERLSFSITVRTTRLLCIALREHLNTIHTDCEIALGLLNHNLESDGSSSPWRRALCMETFRVIYCTPNLATEVYRLFDKNKDRRNFVQDNLAHFVRLAAEKPSLIGLGQQSSIPAGPTILRTTGHEQAVLDASNVAGIISGDIGISEANATGISTQWSLMKTPCLDVLDKSEPPTIPETYIYTLLLTCLNGLSEGLARVVLPLTAQGKTKSDPAIESMSSEDVTDLEESKADATAENGSSEQQPTASKSLQLKPLTPAKARTCPVVDIISHLVNECWPAILATSSTFLLAALDADYYRGLIRSVQKFTQVAGLLKLTTPRDAFLTTLAKSAIPPNFSKGDGMLSPGASPSPRIGQTSDFFSDASPVKGHSRRGSLDSTPVSLSQRNLMCLRALINLAIALGTTLEKSWTIVTESLQKADSILAQSGAVTSREYRANNPNMDDPENDQAAKQSAMNTEIGAVEAAVNRLLQATGDFPNEALLNVLQAFCRLLGDTTPSSTTATTSGPGSIRMPKRTSSTTTLATSFASQSRSVQFALSKVGEISRINVNRLATDPSSGAWNLLMNKLKEIAASPSADNTARLMAADIIGSIALGITLDTVEDDADTREEVQLRSLASLESLVTSLYENLKENRTSPGNADIDVHRAALEALRAILEKCGDSIIAGWRSVFSIVRSTFQVSTFADDEEVEGENEEEQADGNDRSRIDQNGDRNPTRVISPKIARSAFACVQLICSDFLQSLKRIRVIILIDILSQFCGQKIDLNISLTTVTLFWNLSDFIETEISSNSSSKDFEPLLGKGDEELRKTAEGGSFPALWMTLQNQLALATQDERVEVRNSVVQTVYRIVGGTNEVASAQFWTFSFKKVILEMLRINIQSHQRHRASKQVDSQISKSLESTTEMILKGLAQTFTSNLDAITAFPAFESIWQTLLHQFAALFSLGSNEIHASVFDFLSQILGAAETDGSLGGATVRQTLDVLQAGIPKSQAQNDPSGTEKALVAYVNSLKQIYGLVHANITPSQLKRMVENLYSCILESTAIPYSSDLDSLTSLQKSILDCFEALRSDLVGVPSAIMEHLAAFVELPYTVWEQKSTFGGLTFVAFSKRAIDILQIFVSAHCKTAEIYESGSLTKAVRALCLSIKFKYHHTRQGKEPRMWQKATTTMIEILPKILPEVEKFDDESPLKAKFCLTLGDLKDFITRAHVDGLPEGDALFEDESFDLGASDALRTCLGIRLKPEVTAENSLLRSFTTKGGRRLRERYVNALFCSSLIHDDISLESTKPLQRLRKMRQGKTFDPPFKRRLRISYDSLDELFALVTAGLNDSSESPRNGQADPGQSEGNGPSQGDAQAALPQTAFECLLLRCSLPLQRYIADQPLRGKMPTPASQRLELLYILRKMKRLNCVVGRDVGEYFENEETTDKNNNEVTFNVPILNPWKRHLEWLLPLVNKAAVRARHDPEVASALQDVIDEAFSREE